MVYHFVSNVVDPPIKLFMGFDKHENEELIRWGWPEDVWFHVDKLSSAHVYIRLHQNQTIDDIPEPVIQDAVQLCKANSITGNKTNNLDVIYTMWSNLKKTPGMDVGQVAFHDDKAVRKVRVERRINEIINRLNRTKTQSEPKFRDEREARDAEERRKQKLQMKKDKELDKEKQKEHEEQAKLRRYESLMQSDLMNSNKDDGNDSDDFM